jgi:cytochrome b561
MEAVARRRTRERLWVVHWLMAGVFVALYAAGMVMVDLPRSEFRGSLYGLHKSLGVLVLLLLTTRIVLVLGTLTPARPKRWWVNALLHSALYTFMVLVPMTGYLLSNSGGHGVALFGLPLPSLVGKERVLHEAMENAHGWLAYTFAAFVAVHLAAQRKWAAATWKRLTLRNA